MLGCFIFLLTINLLAKAQLDVELDHIDMLISDKRMNEALILLEKYIRQNPIDFDRAQTRVEIILDAKNESWLKMQELMNTIVEDRLSYENKLGLIAELRAFEKDQSDEEKYFLNNIEEASDLTYYPILFGELMKEGAELLSKKKYTDAAQRFADGFDLYYEDFLKQDFQPNFVVTVKGHLDSIENALIEYDKIQNRMFDAFDSLNSALIKYDVLVAVAAYSNLKTVLSDYAEVRNKIVASGVYFRDASIRLQKDSLDPTKSFFLPFSHRFIFGRETDDGVTGILTVLDTQWQDLFTNSQSLLTAMIRYRSDLLAHELSLRTLTQLASDRNKVFEPLFVELTQDLTLGKDILSLYGLLNNPSHPFMEKSYVEYKNALDYNSFLVQKVGVFLEYSATFVANKTSYTDSNIFASSTNPDERIRRNDTSYRDYLFEYATSTLHFIQNIEESFFNIEETRSSIQPNTALFFGLEYPSENLFGSLERIFDLLVTGSYSEITVLWESLSSFFAQGTAVIRTEYELLYNEALFNILETEENGETAILAYPEKSLAILERIIEMIVNDLALLQSGYDFLALAPQSPVFDNPGSPVYITDRSAILEDIKFLENMSLSTQNYILPLQEQIMLAERAKNEAARLFSQAQGALKRGDFTLSRELLQNSRTKYNESLFYQESEELRIKTDLALGQLGLEIVRLENEQVISDVRELITATREQYYNGNFEQAENYILQAEYRWAYTNVTPNTEIINLKFLINNALSFRANRVILPTDPLYPEMSQILNIAYQYFEKGKEFISQGEQDKGMVELNIAREKIQDVEVLYPRNQEVSLLDLRIDKLIDPIAFEKQFAEEYKMAQNEYKQKDSRAHAYINLLDLYEINPDYPGLEDFIYTVEVELGIIIPPPDINMSNKSINLARQASDLLTRGSQDEQDLNEARVLVEEALTINPENQDAMELSDHINTRLGGQSVIVLSAEVETLYQSAVKELSQGNIITAATIVTQLWQDIGLQRSTKIISLKKRLDLLL